MSKTHNKAENKLSDIAEKLEQKEETLNSGRYDSLEEFREAYKDGDIAEQELTTVIHSDNEPGFLSIFGDAGIPYDEIVKRGGIDEFIEVLKETKRQKKRNSRGE